MDAEEALQQVEAMDHESLARLWRFGRPGDMRLQGRAGDRLQERLHELGGIPPAMSKRLGW